METGRRIINKTLTYRYLFYLEKNDDKLNGEKVNEFDFKIIVT